MTALKAIANPRRKIGDILVERGFIKEAEKADLLAKSQLLKIRLGNQLVAEGRITEVDLAQVLAAQYELAYANLEEFSAEPEALGEVPAAIAIKNVVLPLSVKGNTLIVAVADPVAAMSTNFLAQVSKLETELRVGPEGELKRLIGLSYAENANWKDLAVKISKDLGPGSTAPKIKAFAGSSEYSTTSKASVESLVVRIVEDALQKGASDIHIEAAETHVRIRHRIHGVLQEAGQMTIDLHPVIVARMKILCGLDIAEKRQSQDGSFQHRSKARVVDLRVSTLPTVSGEKLVLRVLDKSFLASKMEDLGMESKLASDLKYCATRPHGIVLVTGPTGSGKTTTVYSLMNFLDKVKENIVTIEDPVEYHIENINQVQVHPKAGVTFASALRSILRQDPNIIIVGEVRDKETAEIAIRAALTGHLVVSTLHTNDAVSGLVRLMEMNIDPYLLSASVLGILAQRLVRLLCPHCKTSGVLSVEESELLKDPRLPPGAPISLPKGCKKCLNRGYQGREGIFEFLMPSSAVKKAIGARESETTILDIIKLEGFTTIRQDGIRKILDQSISPEEVLKHTL